MINEQYPSKLLEKAVQELTRLPGVGRKTALRFALYLKQDADVVHSFSDSLTHLRDDVKHLSCVTISPIRNFVIFVQTHAAIVRSSVWLKTSTA